MDWTRDLREIRQMVEFLVRRERKLDVKADVAVRRLERLEKEKLPAGIRRARSQPPGRPRGQGQRREAGRRQEWFVDKGFGFDKVLTGEIVFIHASVVHGGEVLVIGTDAWVQVVSDDARAEGEGNIEPETLGDETPGRRRRTKANRVAQQALTADLAAQSERKVYAVCDHPRGLRDEPAEHFAAPNMGAGGSHRQAATMHSPLSASPPCASSPLPMGDSFNLAGGFRGGRPRPATRAEEAVALIDETIGFCIKVTGSDEGPSQKTHDWEARGPWGRARLFLWRRRVTLVPIILPMF